MKVKPVGPSVCIGCDMGLRSRLIQKSIINYHRKIKTQNLRSNWTYLNYKWSLRDFIVPHSHEPTIQRCEKAHNTLLVYNYMSKLLLWWVVDLEQVGGLHGDIRWFTFIIDRKAHV